MNFESFLLILKDKGLKYQHFEKALELREGLDYKLSLFKLRELIENIRDYIYTTYNITRDSKPKKGGLYADFRFLFKGKIDIPKILRSKKVKESVMIKHFLDSISYLLDITNIASHDNPNPSTFERHTSSLALSLASAIFPYLFHILEEIIGEPKIEQLKDVVEYSKLLYESQKFEYEKDFLAEFRSYDDQIKNRLTDLHGQEDKSVSELDSRDYVSAITSIENALRELTIIRQANGKRNEDIYNCIEARLYVRQGFNYRMKAQEDPSDYSKSIQQYEKALEKVTEIIDNNIKTCYKLMCHCLFADVYRVKSNPENSIESIGKAEELISELEKEDLKVNNFCLAYLYNQSGLIKFQIGIKAPGLLKSALKSHKKSIMLFFKAQRRRWVLKTLIDLCACLYAITLEEDSYRKDDIDKIINFLEGLTKLGHIDYQYKHNINLIRSKILMLKEDDQSNSEAHQLIDNLISHYQNINLSRAMGAEKVVLGEVMLFQDDIDNGINTIKEGLELLQDHKQVQAISLYELEKVSQKLPTEVKERLLDIFEERSSNLNQTT